MHVLCFFIHGFVMCCFTLNTETNWVFFVTKDRASDKLHWRKRDMVIFITVFVNLSCIFSFLFIVFSILITYF